MEVEGIDHRVQPQNHSMDYHGFEKQYLECAIMKCFPIDTQTRQLAF